MAGDPSHDSQKLGLYGAVVVAPKGAAFSSDVGARVDVHIPATATTPRRDYRDFSLILADDDPEMSQDFMPYPTNAVSGKTNINYRAAPAGDSTSTYATGTSDPATPVLWSYVGDETVVHEIVAPGSEQGHVFSLGGLDSPRDALVPDSEYSASQAIGPGESYDAWISGSSGGWSKTVGDFWYGDVRRPFTQVGAWGVQRVLPVPSDCAALQAGGPRCLVGGTVAPTPTPTPTPVPTPTPAPTVSPKPTTSPTATATPTPTATRSRGRGK